MAFSLRSTLSQAVLSTASVSTSFYPAYCFGLPSKAGFSIVCREEMAVAEVLTDKLGSVPFVLVASAAPGLVGKDGFGCFGSVTWNTGPIVSSSGGGFGSLLVAEYAAKKAAKGMLLPVASSAGGRLDFTSYGGFRFPRSLGHPITRGYCSSNGQRTGYCSSNGQRTPSGFPKDPTNAELAMAQFILKVRQETNQWFIEAKVRNTETLAALNMVKANKRAAISMARYTVGNVAYKLVLLLGAVTVIVHTPGNIPEGIKDWVANIFNSLASSSAPAVDPPSAPPAAPPVSAV